ncbi:hypothetical protein HGRIS_001778 [Hohenbuehelia grisea]|uniref:Uncharacterized protein n=1 Tax=Hohenbuehelia grisea TaxID=104357 RepID=A0ABR3JIM8_9AGAR
MAFPATITFLEMGAFYESDDQPYRLSGRTFISTIHLVTHSLSRFTPDLISADVYKFASPVVSGAVELVDATEEVVDTAEDGRHWDHPIPQLSVSASFPKSVLSMSARTRIELDTGCTRQGTS